MLLVNDPGPWQFFAKRPDNIGLPIQAVRQKYLTEVAKFDEQMMTMLMNQSQQVQDVGIFGGGASSAPEPANLSVTFAGATQYIRSGSGTISFTHTPTATPSGIIVFITNTITEFNRVGTVTYGSPLTLVTSVADSAGEKMNTSAYFLGSGVPSGAQTVTVTYSGAGSDRQVINVITVGNASNSAMAVQNYDTIGGDTANPQIALTTGGNNCMALCQIGSGFDSLGSLTALGTMTSINSYDDGAKTTYTDRQTTSSTSNFTIGYTGTIDDVAMVALNVKIA